MSADPFADLLTKAHELASEVYTPAGVLTYWSARNGMLDGRRPCDITRERDAEGMRAIVRTLDVLASGSFA